MRRKARGRCPLQTAGNCLLFRFCSSSTRPAREGFRPGGRPFHSGRPLLGKIRPVPRSGQALSRLARPVIHSRMALSHWGLALFRSRCLLSREGRSILRSGSPLYRSGKPIFRVYSRVKPEYEQKTTVQPPSAKGAQTSRPRAAPWEHDLPMVSHEGARHPRNDCFVPPLQGLPFLIRPPRALPWAGMSAGRWPSITKREPGLARVSARPYHFPLPPPPPATTTSAPPAPPPPRTSPNPAPPLHPASIQPLPIPPLTARPHSATQSNMRHQRTPMSHINKLGPSAYAHRNNRYPTRQSTKSTA